MSVPFYPNGQGKGTITTPGIIHQVEPLQISVPCKRVFIQAAASNGVISPTDGDNACVVVVGGANVSAQLSSRTGVVLYPTNGVWFTVGDVNSLWVDANGVGAQYTYYYETTQ